MKAQLLALCLLVFTLPALAQVVLERGDVLVVKSSSADISAAISVFDSNGALKGTLIEFPDRLLADLFYRDGGLYVGARFPDAIERIDDRGNLLTSFATADDVYNLNYLSPGPNGGLLAVNSSGEVFQFAANGDLVTFRDVSWSPRPFGGIDLASDGCTTFGVTFSRLVQWDACLNTPATFITALLPATLEALRLLPDGTFLVDSVGSPGVIHLAADGNILREYNFFGAGLALDIDGTSFWTFRGCAPMKVDIASGAILTVGDCIDTPGGTVHLAVVGEPRAGLPAPATAESSIPALSRSVLALLALALACTAALKLRLA